MKTCLWLNAATRRSWSLSSMPLPNTSPAMSPTPATRIDVVQARDEHLVLRARLVARRRDLPRDEAALRALRHDDHVLQALRALQAEDLGAEVVRAVAVPDAAARDLAAAQVDALDARRVH